MREMTCAIPALQLICLFVYVFDIFQIRKPPDPHIGIRYVSEPVFGKDKGNAGFGAGVCVALCVSHIYGIFQAVSFHESADGLSL